MTAPHSESRRSGALNLVCITLGVVAAMAAGLLLPHDLSAPARAAAAVGVLMAVWWMTEAVPLEVTGLVPLVLFPLLGVGTFKEAAAPYAQDIIFLFLGGMLIGAAMERWGLHRRMALAAVAGIGASPRRLVGGFLLCTAFISMWVSNTAATVMMLPIGASVAGIVAERAAGERRLDAFGAAVVLAIAFGATIGGVGTIIGTPPITQYAGYMKTTFGREITFVAWMQIGLPVLLVVLPVTWVLLTRVAFRIPAGRVAGVREFIDEQRAGLGRWSRGEVMTLCVFVAAAASWIFVPMLAKAEFLEGTALGGGLSRWTDAGIAVAAAVALFVLPVSVRERRFVLEWREAERVPWGILLLFGGGLSLAEALKTHGVDVYLASLAGPLERAPPLLVMMAFSLGAIVLTEFCSNTALVAAALPVAGAVAQRLGIPPAVLLTTVTLAASLGFMLPGGTAPNALVFASGRVSMRQMMKAGFWLDVLCGVGVPLLVYGAWRVGVLPGV